MTKKKVKPAKSKAVVKAAPVTENALSAQIVLSSIQTDAAPLFKKLQRVTKITTVEELDSAAGTMKALKALAKMAEAKEKTFTVPLEKLKKDVIGLFKPFREQVKEADEEIKQMMLDFHATNQKQKEKLIEDFESNKIKKVDTFTNKSAALEIASKNSSLRKVWKATILDVSKIPRDFMQPNEDLIEEHLRNGGKPIPGVEWKQHNSISI